MKKILIIVILTFLFISSTAMSFEAISSIGAGWLTQEDMDSEFAYFIGLSVPILTKSEAGFVSKIKTTYLYSDFPSGEVQVLRTFSVNEKTLLTLTFSQSTLRWFVGLGGGTWVVLNTEGKGDETLGAYSFNTGLEWKSLLLDIGTEVIQKQGPDWKLFNVGLSLSF